MPQNNKFNFLFLSYKIPDGYLVNQSVYFNELAKFSSFSLTLDYLELYLKKGPKKAEKFILEAIDEQHFQYVFVCIAEGDVTFDIKFFKNISKKAFLTFLIFDTPSYFDALDKYKTQFADLVVIPDNFHTFKYKILEIPVLGNCMALPKEKIEYKKPDHFDWDITFVGNIGAKNNRKKYIDALKAKQFHVDIFGVGSEHGFVEESQLEAIYRKSKININFTGIQYSHNSLLRQNISDRKREIKARPFEVASFGGFVLTEYFPGIESMFETGKEIDVFYNADDLIEKATFYLKNESIREEIAYNGFLRVQRDYSSDVVAKRIWNEVCSRPKSMCTSSYTDRIYRKAYTNFRFKYLFLFFIKLKPLFFFQEFGKLFKYGCINLGFAHFYSIQGFYESLSTHPEFRNRLKKLLSYKIFALLTHQKSTNK